MNAHHHPLRGLGEVPRGRLWWLAFLAGLGAVGLVLVADGIARGVASVASGTDTWRGAVGTAAVGLIVRAVSVWASKVAAARTAVGVKRRLRARLVTRVVERPARRVGAATVLATRGLDDLDDYYRVFLPAVIAAVTVPVLIGARILFADVPSAIVIALCVPLVPVFMVLIGMHTRDSVAARTDALAVLSDHLVELARGLPVLVGLGRVGDQTDALRDVSERYRRTSMATLRTAFLSAFALELIATISVAVVAVIIGIRLIDGGLGLQTGLFVLILAPECFLPLREVGTAFHASEDGLEALRRVEDVLDGTDDPPPPARPGAPAGVQHLSVRFDGRTVDAVDDVTFTAPTGEVTLLSGPSGCGKSTVLGLLAGNRPDGAEVRGTVTTPGAVAWLAQHPRVFGSTPVDELAAYGVSDPVDATSLLDRVGLADAARTDTSRLSPGELRRLAFARVLARVDRGAELVVLDEPTAHLDGVNGARIRAEIAAMRRNVTVLVASHDPQVRHLADTVVHVGADDAGYVPADPPIDASADDPVTDRGGVGTSSSTALTGVERRAVWRELVAFLRPAGWRFLGASAVAALTAGFAITLTAVSGWLIVRAGQGAAMMYLMVAIVGVRFFGIGRAALHYVDRLATHDAVFRALTPLRLRLWNALARRGPADRALLGAGGTLGSLVADADDVRDLAPRVVTPPITAVLVWIGSAIALGLVLPAAGVAVATIGLVALVVPPAVALAADRRAGVRADRSKTELLGVVAALFAAADDLRANGVARAAVRRVEAMDAEQERAEHRAAWATGVGDALVVLLCGVLALAMLPIAAAGVEAGAISTAVVAVLVLTPLGLAEPFSGVVQAALRAPTLARVLARLHRVTAMTDRVVPGEATLERADRLGLERVAFRWPDTDTDVFADLDAEVSRGEWLVVTGPSGSGKSTLLSLLLRHIDPTVGRYVLDDDVDARRFTPASVRERIAWCPQEAHLFDSTLRTNLALARPRGRAPDEAEMRAVLERVGLGDLLDELADGLDTTIGSAGAKLSGGQRQRVAVARMLLTPADAVLVDEPTAHLDELGGQRLLDDLRVALADRTTVLVTHRSSTVGPDDGHLRLDSPAVTWSEPVVTGHPPMVNP